MQDMKKLRIGRIHYANLFPIFYSLERECDCSRYEFVEGVPSVLNQMLREGDLDVSPSSSIEYLRHKDRYNIVEGISVSSRGRVGSVFLFSRRPVEQLGAADIAVTSQSETSVALLRIILSRFYGLSYSMAVASDPEAQGADAFLLIGDDALRYRKQHRLNPSLQEAYPFVYDLGELWRRHTGLPFVFALWIVRREFFEIGDERLELFERFLLDLARSSKAAIRNLAGIAGAAPMASVLSRDEIVAYWNLLDYSLDEEHREGLQRFADLLL